jgi:hypothetical protein
MQNDSGNTGGQGNPPADASGAYSEKYQHQPVAARVPERVGHGVLSTGVLIQDSPSEFVLDFVQGLSRPYHVAARVVIAPPVMEQMVVAVGENLGKYQQAFGVPPALPKGPPSRPSIAEIYENFKVGEDVMCGVYANSVMIGHSAAEFYIDFITSFYPNAAVSARVYLAAPRVSQMFETLKMAMNNYRLRYQTAVAPVAPAAPVAPVAPVNPPAQAENPPGQAENPPAAPSSDSGSAPPSTENPK